MAERRGVWRPAPLLSGSVALHVAGAAALALAPEAWPAICASLFANHVVLAAHGFWPQSGGLGPALTRLSEDAARRGEVALTFDDGPDPEVTPRVLDLLDEARRKMGSTAFWAAMRAYLAANRNKIVGTTTLLETLDAATPIDLGRTLFAPRFPRLY